MSPPYLYQTVKAEELVCYNHYTIHAEERCYYTGTSMGLTDDLAIFWNMVSVFPGRGVIKMVSPQYFSKERLFKRIIYESEQKRAYRNAFEKRAVNQIIASIVGHGGAYY
jgi:hypothetical protein